MITFKIPTPPSTNKLFFNRKDGGRGRTKEYNAWLEGAGWEMVAQKVRPIIGPVLIDIRVQDSGQFDLDNIVKPTLDLLVKQRTIEDDKRPIVRELTVGWAKGIRGIVISVQALRVA